VAVFPYISTTYIALVGKAEFTHYSIATILWYMIPNGGVRTVITKPHDFLARIVNWVYKKDGDTNGFPSNHVFMSIICSYYLSLSYPNMYLLWILLGIMVSISTVFAKQHYIIDIIGGIMFAVLSILISNILV